MSKKIILSGNYTVIIDTVSSEILFESPTKQVRYIRVSPEEATNLIRIYADGARTHQAYDDKGKDDVFVDSGDTPIADIYAWLQTNTGA